MKFAREFGAAFLFLAVLQSAWIAVFTEASRQEDWFSVLLASNFQATVGLAVALVFAGHLLPARVGAERIQERAGQLGTSSFLHNAIGVLAGVALMGGWGGPVGLGVAVAAMACAGRSAGSTPESD